MVIDRPMHVRRKPAAPTFVHVYVMETPPALIFTRASRDMEKSRYASPRTIDLPYSVKAESTLLRLANQSELQGPTSRGSDRCLPLVADGSLLANLGRETLLDAQERGLSSQGRLLIERGFKDAMQASRDSIGIVHSVLRRMVASN